MTDIEKFQHILEMAEKATPGPWTQHRNSFVSYYYAMHYIEPAVCALWSGGTNDAAYLSLLDPQTVTEIVKDAMRWQKWKESLVRDYDYSNITALENTTDNGI